MKNSIQDLPESVVRFVTARKQLGGVSAVLLYGSYARGTQHEKSDVDIVFVVDRGFKSELVVYDGIDFEVLEATKSSMYAYWQKNWDEDRHWYLWKDAKIIYDRDGEGAQIVSHALSLVGNREPWSREKIESRKQVERAKIEKIQFVSKTDPGTAAMLVVEFVRALSESWFKIRGQFVPSTKEFLTRFATQSPEFEAMVRDFYSNTSDLNAKILQSKKMIEVIYRLD